MFTGDFSLEKYAALVLMEHQLRRQSAVVYGFSRPEDVERPRVVTIWAKWAYRALRRAYRQMRSAPRRPQTSVPLS